MSTWNTSVWTEAAPMQGRDPLARAVRELSICSHGNGDDAQLLTTLCAHAADIVGAASCAVALADDQQRLRDVFASDDEAQALVLFQVQCSQGPCVEAFHAGEVVMVDDLSQQTDRWPRLTQPAQRQHVRRVMAVPLRSGAYMLGVLQVMCSARGTFTDSDVLAVEALTDVVADGIVRERVMGDTLATVGQLQHALQSRIVIEQAKGMFAERTGVSLSEAFEQLRRFARNNHRRLHDVCDDLIQGRLDAEDLRPARK
jgi:GAF domain-containing protein